ncbi:MAG TPA: glycosyltransferase family 1 protein [Burkholderiales bacterium]|nr:glycosyltransferase family 1 protein [Burkholderiales bacterium]
MKNAEEIIVESFAAHPSGLRIALVTETFPPEVNGVAMTLGNLVKGLLQRGHAVQIIRPRQAREESVGQLQGTDQVLAKGIPIPNYPDLRFGLLSENRFNQLWRQKRPDIVHVATEGPLGWYAITAARKLQLPVTSSFHTNFHQYSRHYGMGLLKISIEAYLRKFHNRTMATLAPTQTVARTLQDHGYRNVSVLSRGVAIEQFTPVLRSQELRDTWGANAGDVVALYVGRLAKEKNVGVVLMAFTAIQARLPSAKLVFVGDGPLRKSLEDACPQAIFTGIKTGKELAAHYASSDLFLFPSLTETFGNVVPEALASGLAVMSYAVAAAANLIKHDYNGALVAPGEELQFVNTAVVLATEHDKRNALRQQAAPSVVHMTWSAVTDGFVSTLRAVMECHDNQFKTTSDKLLAALPIQRGQPNA